MGKIHFAEYYGEAICGKRDISYPKRDKKYNKITCKTCLKMLERITRGWSGYERMTIMKQLKKQR